MASDGRCRRRRHSGLGSRAVRLPLVCASDDADDRGRIARWRGGPDCVGDREPVWATNASVRLKIVETSGAADSADAFSSDKADLAVVRGDVGDLSHAQAVVIVARAVALLIAPPGSSVTELQELKRTTVGVVAGKTNDKLTGC